MANKLFCCFVKKKLFQILAKYSSVSFTFVRFIRNKSKKKKKN